MVRAPQRFTSRCEFADPLTDTTALLFPLQRLLAGLQGFLRSRDRAVQRYTLCLEHHRGAVTRLEIGLARPGRDAAQLLAWPANGSPRARWTQPSTGWASRPTNCCSPWCCRAICSRAPHSTASSSSR